jgi:hypothetical protein
MCFAASSNQACNMLAYLSQNILSLCQTLTLLLLLFVIVLSRQVQREAASGKNSSSWLIGACVLVSVTMNPVSSTVRLDIYRVLPAAMTLRTSSAVVTASASSLQGLLYNIHGRNRCVATAQVPRGAPWFKTCSNIKAGRKCGARGAPCNTGYVCENCAPGSAWPIAYCEAPAGIWRVEGSCVAKAGMPDCPNKPKPVQTGEAWPADCVNGTASATPTVCNVDCKAGFSGQAVATCTAAGWVVGGTCEKDGPGAGCPGSPDQQPNAKPFDGCTDKQDGDICDAAW